MHNCIRLLLIHELDNDILDHSYVSQYNILDYSMGCSMKRLVQIMYSKIASEIILVKYYIVFVANI